MARWQVRCDDHVSYHKTQAQAERRKADIEKAGLCTLPHKVEETR